MIDDDDRFAEARRALIERVELEARRDPKFRRCLTGVWGLSTSIQDRVAKYTSTVPDPL